MINNQTKRNLIVALYVIIGIIFTGLIPFLQPTGMVLTISGILIAVSLIEVWQYKPNGKTKPIFWTIFLVLIASVLYCFNIIPLDIPNFIVAIILGAIALIIGLKDWM